MSLKRPVAPQKKIFPETSMDMVPGIATPFRRRPAILEKQAGSALSVAELFTRNFDYAHHRRLRCEAKRFRRTRSRLDLIRRNQISGIDGSARRRLRVEAFQSVLRTDSLRRRATHCSASVELAADSRHIAIVRPHRNRPAYPRHIAQAAR
jgi:hypothetical protein